MHVQSVLSLYSYLHACIYILEYMKVVAMPSLIYIPAYTPPHTYNIYLNTCTPPSSTPLQPLPYLLHLESQQPAISPHMCKHQSPIECYLCSYFYSCSYVQWHSSFKASSMFRWVCRISPLSHILHVSIFTLISCQLDSSLNAHRFKRYERRRKHERKQET